MKTLEQIMTARGFVPGPIDDSENVRPGTCTYSPWTPESPAPYCGQTARWHARVSSDRQEDGVMLIACDSHLGIIVSHYGQALMGMHEFEGGCALDSWWIEQANEGGSLCLSEKDAIRMGYLKYPD